MTDAAVWQHWRIMSHEVKGLIETTLDISQWQLLLWQRQPKDKLYTEVYHTDDQTSLVESCKDCLRYGCTGSRDACAQSEQAAVNQVGSSGRIPDATLSRLKKRGKKEKKRK